MTFVDSHEVVYSLLERLREKSSVVNPEHHCCGLSGLDGKKKACQANKKLDPIVENAARLLELLEFVDDEGTDEFPEEIKDLVFKTHCRPEQGRYTLKHIDAWWESVKQRQDEQVEDLVIGKAKKAGRPGPPPREAAPVTPVKKQSRRTPYQVTPDFSPSTVVPSDFDDDRDLDYQDSGDEDSEAESDNEAIFDTEPDDPETPDTIPSLEGCKTRPIVIDDEPSPTRHRSARATVISLSNDSNLSDLDDTKSGSDADETVDEEQERQVKPIRLPLRSKDKGKALPAAQTPISKQGKRQPAIQTPPRKDVEWEARTRTRPFPISPVTILDEIIKDYSKKEFDFGAVYVLYSKSLSCYKIGFSDCNTGYFTRYEDRRNCSFSPDIQLVAISKRQFPGARRVEKLVHTDLFEDNRFIIDKCPTCQADHREFFRVDDVDKILKCVRRWTQFVLYPAYQSGKLKQQFQDHADSFEKMKNLQNFLDEATKLLGNDNLQTFEKFIPKAEFKNVKVKRWLSRDGLDREIPTTEELATRLESMANKIAEIERMMRKHIAKPEETGRGQRPALSDITHSKQLNSMADEREHDEQPPGGTPQARPQQRVVQTEKKSRRKKVMRGAVAMADSGARGLDKLRSKVQPSKKEKAAVAPEQDSGPARGLRRRLTGGFSKTKRTATF